MCNRTMSTATETRVPCSEDTRNTLKRQKRAGWTYDELLQKMIDQFDPDAAIEAPERGNA